MLPIDTEAISDADDRQAQLSLTLGESDVKLEPLGDEIDLSIAADRSDDLPTESDTLLLVGSSAQVEIATSAPQFPQDRSEIAAELDALLISWEQATPHPPQLASTADDNSIAEILDTITTTAPVTHTQQLLQELNTIRAQLNAACTQLEILHQRNQLQVDRVDANVHQAKQIKFRTQQLAQHSHERVETARKVLGSLEQIRSEIVTNLDKFGGYEDIHAMLAQLETTRYALVVAHERATIGQQAFYDSLQAIQQQVATTSHDSEQKFRQYHESIQSLSQTIATDRLKVAGMSVELSTKLHNLHALDFQINTLHDRTIDRSQAIESRLLEVERGFFRLSQSVSQEQEQFYELTVQTIEKAESVRSQFADIIAQINSDRESISLLTAEIASVRQNTEDRLEFQLNKLDLHQDELISICSNLQALQKDRLAIAAKFSKWLWILSVAVVILFVLLVRILSILK
jgi:hypothetical protein